MTSTIAMVRTLNNSVTQAEPLNLDSRISQDLTIYNLKVGLWKL